MKSLPNFGSWNAAHIWLWENLQFWCFKFCLPQCWLWCSIAFGYTLSSVFSFLMQSFQSVMLISIVLKDW